MNHKHFPDAQAFRAWLRKNHRYYSELIVAFHRIGTGKKSITCPEALDVALYPG